MAFQAVVTLPTAWKAIVQGATMTDSRTIVLTALTELLHWDNRQALMFLDVLTEHECEDIEEHVRESEVPIVGVAAVVYRVRLRLAGGDEAAKKRAAAEAGEHYRLIPEGQYRGLRSATQVPTPPRVHRVTPRIGGRRREGDTR
jgi:hypothetical protein